ncbi:hypothetical protein NDI85_18435 [Halomicroarcula sp. S1AR25-4]|nr:hypothetical protein [Halomicroarcula sp. S1AR25-4]MDS0279773.1 hypothetical protein [Halomicroarcula sp. S1AR25-4]
MLPERREFAELFSVGEPARLSPAIRFDRNPVDKRICCGQLLESSEIVDIVSELLFETERRLDLIPAGITGLSDLSPAPYVIRISECSLECLFRSAIHSDEEQWSLPVVVLEIEKYPCVGYCCDYVDERERIAIDLEFSDKSHTNRFLLTIMGVAVEKFIDTRCEGGVIKSTANSRRRYPVPAQTIQCDDEPTNILSTECRQPVSGNRPRD